MSAVALSCTVQVDVHLPALPSYDLYVDPGASLELQEAVREAVSEWQTYTDVQLHVHEGAKICTDPGCFFLTDRDSNLFGTLDAVTDSTWDGWTAPGVIFVAPNLSSYDVTAHTVTHELGHALGLAHHPRPYVAVMAPNYQSAADHVACDDVDQYYSLRTMTIPRAVAPCTNAPGPWPWDGGTD